MNDIKTDKYTLMLGECLERMQEIETGSVDMVMADLPYGTTACKWDSVIPFAPLWEQYRRVCKKNAAIVLTASQPFTSALVMSNIKDFKYCWTWNKGKGGNFATAKSQPLRVVEDVVVFCREKTVYHPQMVAALLKNKRSRNRIYAAKQDTTHGIASGVFKVSETHDENMRHPINLLDIKSTEGECNNLRRVHPTQKPVALMEYLIRTYTNEGETVLDNTAGSFTTGVAALKCNRSFIGIERDETYFKIGVKRMVDEQRALSSCGMTGTNIRDWKVDWPFQEIQNPCMELCDERK